MENIFCDLNPRIVNAVSKAKLTDFGSVLSLSGPDLQRLTQLSASDVRQLQTAAANAVKRAPHTTVLNLYNKTGPKELERCRLSTGCLVLDGFLKGGLLSQALTEIAGESACGKTQICLQLCLTVQFPKALGGLESGAVYICTEDVFPNRRLAQMISLLRSRSPDPRLKDIKFTDNIYIEHAAELDDLCHCITKRIPMLLSMGRVRLVVVDSIAALFRCEARSVAQRARQMTKVASQLLRLAKDHNIPIVCVNQVTDVVDSDATTNDPGAPRPRKVLPSLGLAWSNLVTVRLMLARTHGTVTVPQKDPQGKVTGSSLEVVVRTMEVMFAPHLPNTVCRYIVDQEGVKGL